MKILFQEFDVAKVMEYFVKGFEKKVSNWDWFYDPAKGKIVFKLYVIEESKE